MDAEDLFLKHIALIDRIASFVCRRNHLDTEESKEFASDVKLKLIDGNYSIIRKFEGRSAFPTYLTTVITRLFYQYRVERWGKWRPSAEAKRLGEKAVTIERLLTRDNYSLHEVEELLTTPAGSPYTRAEIDQIYLRLPERHPRPVLVAEDVSPDAVAADTDPTDGLESADREKVARHAAEVIDQAIAALPAEDQIILRMRFWQSKRVPEIAGALHLDQKKTYKRIDKLLATLRAALERAGIAAADIGNLLSKGDQELECHVEEHPGNSASSPSDTSNGGIAEDGESRKG